MGKVKSVRFNNKTEHMFNVLRNYYSRTGTTVSDTEIISRGIEVQYEEVSTDLNDSFRKRMFIMLDNNMYGRNVFEQTANMLEILSVSNGNILKDEFWCFLKVNVERSTVYDIVDGERDPINKQYEKIYETLLKSNDERSLEQAINDIMQAFKELFGKEYQEKDKK
jgi:hypothetical protein